MYTLFSFEDGLPECITADNKSTIQISDKHYRDGKHSLRWDFCAGSELKIDKPIGYSPFMEGSLSKARDTFAVCVYCENQLGGKLSFHFGEQEVTNCKFDMDMQFTGWRTVWVQFERDMEGEPTAEMDTLRILAAGISGTVYIDQLVLCVPIDPRHPVRDNQVPFVNLQADTAANSHWLSLYRFSLLQQNGLKNIGDQGENEETFSLLRKRFDDFLLSMRKAQPAACQEMNHFKERYSKYNISIRDGAITGVTVDAACHRDVFPNEKAKELLSLTNPIDIKDCADFLLDVAYAYSKTENLQYKRELGNIFANITRHLLDQGWAEGSGLGTTHHLGYPLRKYFWAMYLMRDLLDREGLLESTQKAMSWYSGSGRIFREAEDMQGESMDTLNTLSQGIVASILLMKNDNEKAVCLKALSNWLSTCLLPAPGLRGPFKIDGCAFHHCNHYPAYALGGFTGIAPVIYFISGTKFTITEAAHANVRKALLMLRVYCNHYSWLISMSSRHPKGDGEHSRISSLMPFRFMAMAGTPDGKESLDHEVAAAYLRLAEPVNEEYISYFKEQGVIAEKAPVGHWNLNYAAAALHRRDHWLAGVRGHSRYLWANETYTNANLYGRYITHGNLQILSKGDPINHRDSGYVQAGWDFNCWPGTTTIHLPVDELKSDVRNVDIYSGFEEMLLSDETYAGGTGMDNNGVFAMKLHEHPKYNGSHRARKSYFFFDNRIVCIGTDIENENKDNLTHTTLFQNHLADENSPIWMNDSKEVTGLNFREDMASQKPIWLVDNVGNGYYVYGGQSISVFREHQHSKAQDTGEDTCGNFTKAWINHGNAPENAEYRYTIVVDTNAQKMQAFAENMMNNEPHTILNATTHSHSVRDNGSGIIGYALFEPCEDIMGGTLAAVDTPSLVMEKLCGDNLNLSVCDPDLRLYEGKEPDQYDQEGNLIEVSLYSRKWRKSPSKESTMKISLRGKWNAQEAGCKIEYTEFYTNIYIPCKDALTTSIALTKAY